jgi:hypothetical protein
VTRDSVGAHLSKEARFRTVEHVAVPEPTSAGRRGPKLRDMWQYVDVHLTPCLDLKLVCEVPDCSVTHFFPKRGKLARNEVKKKLLPLVGNRHCPGYPRGPSLPFTPWAAAYEILRCNLPFFLPLGLLSEHPAISSSCPLSSTNPLAISSPVNSATHHSLGAGPIQVVWGFRPVVFDSSVMVAEGCVHLLKENMHLMAPPP